MKLNDHRSSKHYAEVVNYSSVQSDGLYVIQDVEIFRMCSR